VLIGVIESTSDLTTAATKLIGMVLCNGVVGNLKALFSEDRQERIP